MATAYETLQEAFADAERARCEEVLVGRDNLVRVLTEREADAKRFAGQNKGGSTMTFGEALEAAKQGKKIQRAGWNGKGQYVVAMPGYSPVACNENTAKAHGIEVGMLVTTAPYLVMRAVNPPDTEGLYLVPGWLASQTDMLAEDWSILES